MSESIHLHAVLTPLYSVYVPCTRPADVIRAFHQEEDMPVVMKESGSGACWPSRHKSAMQAAREYVKMRRDHLPSTANHQPLAA